MPAECASAPSERKSFARRLRDLRVPRGYRTARSFAEKLGIDENRYTRYERAEVEPDLSLLIRICKALDVSPDVLLGFTDPVTTPGFATPPQSDLSPDANSRSIGLHDGANGARANSCDVDRPAGSGSDFGAGATTLAHAAWRLAEEVAALTTVNHASAAASPLGELAAATATYKSLISDPFAGIESLVRAPELNAADIATQTRIATLARRLALAASAEAHHPGQQA